MASIEGAAGNYDLHADDAAILDGCAGMGVLVWVCLPACAVDTGITVFIPFLHPALPSPPLPAP